MEEIYDFLCILILQHTFYRSYKQLYSTYLNTLIPMNSVHIYKHLDIYFQKCHILFTKSKSNQPRSQSY